MSPPLTSEQGNVDKVSMFQILTIMAFFILLPIAIFFEGTPVLPTALTAKVCIIRSCTLTLT